MGFLKRLLGSENKDTPYVDKDGIYLYVLCDNCGTPVRVRADKQYDLITEDGGFSWHKTIVDNRCFRPMPTVVHFNPRYEVVSHEITGGHYITEEEYTAALESKAKAAQNDNTSPDA